MFRKKPAKAQFDGLKETRAFSLSKSRGAWWWPFVTPVWDVAKDFTYLRCEICGWKVDATDFSVATRAHLKAAHGIERMARPTEQDVAKLRSEYLENNGDVPICTNATEEGSERTVRKRKGQPSTNPNNSQEGHPKLAKLEHGKENQGVHCPGIPAQCRRECFTEAFMVAAFQQQCSEMVNSFSNYVKGIPEIDLDSVDIDVSDLMFANQYEKCSADVDVAKVNLNTTSLMRKSGFHYDRTEKSLRQGVYVNDSDSSDTEEKSDDDNEGEENQVQADSQHKDDDREPSRVGEYLTPGGGIKKRKHGSRRRKKYDDDDVTREEPWMDTLRKVHGCMEKMAKKMFSVHDMLASHNVRTGGMYRTSYIKICHKLTEYLEGIKGRIFRSYFQRDRSFLNRMNCASDMLTPEEARGIDDLIIKMEKHLNKQYELAASGVRLVHEDILSARRYFEEMESEVVEGGDANGGEVNCGDANGGEANGGEANGGEANGGEANGGEANGGEANGGEANGGDLSAAGNGKQRSQKANEGLEDADLGDRVRDKGGSSGRGLGGGDEPQSNGRGLKVNEDVIVFIKICHPGLHKVKELHILAAGHHTLKQVFSLLRCEVSMQMRRLGHQASSGYLFLEGTFYKHLSATDSEDYTKKIKEFCQVNNSGFPLDPGKIPHTEFKDSDMSCTVSELLLRASNQPLYLYCHHGSCEHLVQIVDARLCTKWDPIDLKSHPIMANIPAERHKRCIICQHRRASVVAHGDGLGVSDPGFFCADCFECLHYDEWGNLQVKPFISMPCGPE